ncbi:MAG: hypothetical protein ACREQH_05510 [Candidatus Binatus sp.]
MTTLANTFARRKYVVLRSLLRDPRLSFLYKYVRKLADAGAMRDGDAQVPDALAGKNDFVMDELLRDFLPKIESATALKLFPTFSYFRVYRKGSALEKHTDRPAGEISITLCLGYRAQRPWPIRIKGPAGSSAIELKPGDGLLYRGCECEHWREPFPGQHAAQLTLHYVDQNGPNADWKLDRRPGLDSIRRYVR